jgi:choline dehydrogenase
MRPLHDSTFDFIVVGGGTAGCVVARRLSESGQHRVLLLEAGGSDRSVWIQVPIGYGRTFNDPRFNWGYHTEPDPALGGRAAYWPRGKVLGGSGSLNAMIYVRGQPGDFDDWAAEGNPGWAWQDVLQYFRKSEDHVWGATEFHGAGGPMRVSDFADQVHPLCENFLRACGEAGIARNADFNGASHEGAGLWQATIRNGIRCSTASAFLRPALRAGRVQLQLHAHVTRVVLEGRRAVGVECRIDGAARRIHATREVILSGGAINSPQLLMLSGLGDGARLQAVGLPSVHHLPGVGIGLQDHLCVSYFFRSRVPTLNNQLHPWWGRLWAGLRYVATRRGPLSMSVNQAGAFVRSRPGLARPDLHLYFNPLSYTANSATGGTASKLLNPDPFPAFLLAFNTCRPTSRGRVGLRSADPFDKAVIETNFLSTPEDVAAVSEGSHVVRRIASQPALASVIEREMFPGPERQSPKEILEDFRARCGSVYHACSTARMGPDPSRHAVDARLRVHGVQGLRVIDASVFPAVTSGNTNAPVVMVAEKGADMVLEDLRAAAG